jgi:hypothetical protein
MKEALRLALGALKTIDEAMPFPVAKLAQACIKAALSQPEQEPVAWRTKNFYENQEGWFYADWHQDGLTPQVAELLYTTPPQRTWVGLTGIDYAGLPLEQVGLVLWAEAKLKEKNT